MKKQILAAAAILFASNEKIDVLHMTDDGQGFVNAHDAENHAKYAKKNGVLATEEVVEVNRSSCADLLKKSKSETKTENEPVAYKDMKQPALKAELDKRKIAYPAGAVTNQALIDLLEADDKSKEEEA